MQFTHLRKKDHFLYSTPDPSTLETFTNPGVSEVTLTSQEFTSLCPITGQPDYSTVLITYFPKKVCVESKSLKLYLNSFRMEGQFIEQCSQKIQQDLQAVLDCPVKVQITSTPRGGISVQGVSSSFRKKPLFSFEVPIRHLEDFTEDQDFLFTLSFLYSDNSYLTYLKKYQDRGGTVYLDNSYNELHTPTSNQHLLELTNTLSTPVDYILPPDSYEFTFSRMVREAKELLNSLKKTTQILPISHSPQHEGLIQMEIPYLDYIAIPYEVRHKYPKSVTNLKTHYLGLNSITELTSNNPYSCDTGMPIKLALEGLTINDWVQKGCPHIYTKPEFFSHSLTPYQIDLAKKNILSLKEATQCFIK